MAKTSNKQSRLFIFFARLWLGLKKYVINLWERIKDYFIELWHGTLNLIKKFRWSNIKIFFKKFRWSNIKNFILSLNWKKILIGVGIYGFAIIMLLFKRVFVSLNTFFYVVSVIVQWVSIIWIIFAVLEKTKLKWTKLDGYIMKRFLTSLFGSLVLFVSIYMLTQIFQDLRYLPKDADAKLLFQHYTLNSLYWVIILQPLSFLFAGVYVLGSMVRTKELVAIISTGTSIYRITFYMVVFSVLYFIAMVSFVEDRIIFPAYQKSLILMKIVKKQATMDSLDRLKDNRNFSIFGANNLLYIVGYYNALSKEINDITIVQFISSGVIEDDKLEQISNKNIWLSTNIEALKKKRNLLSSYQITVKLRIDAQKAIWVPYDKKWQFANGTIRWVKNGGEKFTVEKFTKKTFDFIQDKPYYFEKVWYNVDAMTMREAKKHVEKLKKSHQDYREPEARYLAKYSYPLGVILVILAGIGILNVASRKASVVINLIISSGLFLVYYIFFAMGLALAGKGVLSPQVGAYTGAAFFLVVSLRLYTRAKT